MTGKRGWPRPTNGKSAPFRRGNDDFALADALAYGGGRVGRGSGRGRLCGTNDRAPILHRRRLMRLTGH